MEYQFQTDLSKRKLYLKNIAKKHPTWKLRIFIFWLLMVISIGIIAGIAYLLTTLEKAPTPETIMIFLMMAVIFACIPFFIGISVKNSAKYKCASPFSGMTNGILVLTDTYLEFVFWKASKEAPAAYSSKRALYRDEDKFVYHFDKNNIKSLKINDLHVCQVSGAGSLTVPIWASSNDTIETKSAKNFSFVTCFNQDDCEKIISNWRDA